MANLDLVFYNRIITNSWAGLRDLDKWDKVSKEVFAKNNYYVSPATGEDIILIPAMVWFLMKNWQLCIASSSECNLAEEWMNRSPDFNFRWFYMIDSRFEHAPPPEMISGKFEEGDYPCWGIDKPVELFNLQAAGIGDVSTCLNVYAVNDADREAIIALLRTSNLDAQKIVAAAGLFVATTFGFDMGYYNGITIKSSSCIDELVDKLELEFTKRISAYQSRVNSVKSVDEWLSELEVLALGIDSQSAR